jgi:hypothetical protein
MKNERFNKVLAINKLVFPYLIGLTYFFLLLESYMYIGFLRHFFLVDSRFFLVLSIISIFLIFYQKLQDKNYKEGGLEKLVIDINSVLFLPLFVSYTIMVFSNAKNYPNYVFATYHIQPQNFVNLVYLGLALLVLIPRFSIKFEGQKFLERFKIFSYGKAKGAREKLFFFLLIFLLIFYFVDNFVKVTNRIFNDFAFMATHLNYSYDDKMRHTWGFYYDYMKFIADNTPVDSTILIPPQSGHWLSSGNQWLDRYFTYPRNLMQGNVFDIPPNGYDYVMISKGEWLNNDVDWGWPKVYVKAEKIWYIDPQTLKVSEFKEDFDPKDPFNMQAWGLIKVKKE